MKLKDIQKQENNVFLPNLTDITINPIYDDVNIQILFVLLCSHSENKPTQQCAIRIYMFILTVQPSRTPEFNTGFLVVSVLFNILVFCVVYLFLVLFVCVLYLACLVLPMFLDCPFLIPPSGFSNVYFTLDILSIDQCIKYVNHIILFILYVFSS